MLLLLTLTTTACSVFLPPMPKTGAVASGQPLSLRESMVTEREHYKEHVGTVRDENGRTLANIYEEGTLIKHIPVWYGYQGTEYVDAEDFFRIAGDADDAERVRRARKIAYLMNRGGWIAAGVGVGLMLVAGALPNGDARTGFAIGGLFGMVLGVPAALYGAKRLSPERHGVGSLSAAMAAEQYNQQLQDRGSSASPGGARVGMAVQF